MSSTPTMPAGGKRPTRRLALAVWGNPLARPTDRLEATVVIMLTLLWLLTFPIFAVVGSVLGSQATAVAAHQQQDRSRTTAELVQDAPAFVISSQGIPISEQVPAAARWVAPDGSERTGTITVASKLRAGDHMPIWVDRTGAVTDPPIDPTAAGLLVAAGTAISWLIWGAALAGIAVGHRRFVIRRRLAHWAEEWQGIEPLWSGRERPLAP